MVILSDRGGSRCVVKVCRMCSGFVVRDFLSNFFERGRFGCYLLFVILLFGGGGVVMVVVER